jgi:uncharacterized DUF497 family protein
MKSELSFDWDDSNTQHLGRHRVTQAEFEQVMRNDPILFDYQDVGGEDRWTGIGSTSDLRILVVAFTIREGCIHAVTAFRANKQQARKFWEQKGSKE